MNCTSTGGGEGEKQGQNNWVLVSIPLIFTLFLALCFHVLCICIKYVYLYMYQLHHCVFPPVVTLCVEAVVHTVRLYPLFHHTGASVTWCVSFLVLFLYFSSSVFNVDSIGLGVCLLQEPAEA